MRDRIEVGDAVTIVYTDRSPISAKVIHIPSQTGELWIFQNNEWDELIYQNPMSTNLDRIVLFNGKKL